MFAPPSVSGGGSGVFFSPFFPNGYSTYLGLLGSPFSFFYNNGDKEREKGTRGDKRLVFLFALNLSGSGNPEYAIHRVVEPEIDHVES